MNATGAQPLQMLCPLTKVICLLTVGTATLILQTGKEGIKGLKGLFSQVGEENQSEVTAISHKVGRECRTKAGEQMGLEEPVCLLVSVLPDTIHSVPH